VNATSPWAERFSKDSSKSARRGRLPPGQAFNDGYVEFDLERGRSIPLIAIERDMKKRARRGGDFGDLILGQWKPQQRVLRAIDWFPV
jgi:hypothetical protein